MQASAGAYGALLPHLADLPDRMMRLQQQLLGVPALDIAAMAEVNKAFAHRLAMLWQESAADSDGVRFFEYLRKAHTLQAQWCQALVDCVALPSEEATRLRFLLTQWVAASHPDNFLGTNPRALEKSWRTGGESWRQGQRHLERDLARGRLTMCDESAFEVGRNIACTPGAVVFENSVMQLIQYTPMGARVERTPLLIVPPFINKYYILDLSPENSFVRYACESGLQVFMISWRNPEAETCALRWDDYAREGVRAAMEVVLAITRVRQLHALGFCVGGTLLASTLAAGSARGQVATLTLLATLLDFSEVGEIRAYLDEAYVARCESQYGKAGIVPGSQLAAAFASLRPDELIWRFVIQNYLMGETPAAFDLLYWNSDSANVPGPLYVWYLRQLYLGNKLRQPGALRIDGETVDLAQLKMPAYVLGAEKDHIVPWQAAHASAAHLGGDRQFVLASSGHVAGIVCPPRARARSYRVAQGLWDSAQAMRDSSPSRPGSWWPHWRDWVGARSGKSRMTSPKQLGAVAYPVIEPAPGRYLRTGR